SPLRRLSRWRLLLPSLKCGPAFSGDTMDKLLTPAHPHHHGEESHVPEEARAARRLSRRQGLFAPELLATALKQSFVMLRPDIQWKNPVMFTVEVGTALSVIFTVRAILGYGGPSVMYLIALDLWLFLTVLFANFAEALAEARG